MTFKTFVVASVFFILLVVVFQVLSVSMDFTGDMYASGFDEHTLVSVYESVARARERAVTGEVESLPVAAADAGAYLLVGDAGDACFDSMQWMMERFCLPTVTMEKLGASAYQRAPAGILVATSDLQKLGDLDSLLAYVEAGGQVIFARLPQQRASETEWFFDELGILDMGGSVTHEQFELYEGLLLGGIVRYEEYPMPARRITLSNLCKVWGAAWEGDPNDREVEVPLLFEKRIGQGVVCVVNAPFLEDISGIGVLGALLAIGQEAFITPVVNAASISFLNFPYLGGDEARLESIYVRNARKTARDVLWQDMAHLLRSNDLSATLYIPAAEGGYGPEEEQLFGFLIREMISLNSEFALMDSVNIVDALRASFPQYAYSVTAGEDVVAGTKILVTPLEGNAEDFTITGQGVLRVPILTEGFADDEPKNFRARNFASALYMIHHAVDMARPILLEGDEDIWQNLNRSFGRMVYAARYPFPQMQSMDVSEAAVNVARYALVSPRYAVDAEGMAVDSGITEASYFLLRTHKQIGDTQGLSLTALEDGIYLVTLQGQTGRILWKEDGR